MFVAGVDGYRAGWIDFKVELPFLSLPSRPLSLCVLKPFSMVVPLSGR
jgi:hypothetical protein